MKKVLRHTINLIRAEICGEYDNNFNPVSLDEWEKILELSAKHDLAHIIGKTISNYKISVDEKIKNIFFSIQLNALLRYEKIRFSQEKLYEVFEKNCIQYIPLKGSVLREVYSEPWLRTSCDIDVLIKKSDIECACKLLADELGWQKYSSGTHDVSFFSNADIHIELHFNLIEENATTEGIVLHNWKPDILAEVWSNISPVEGYKYQYRMNDEFAYFYHIAHMAKHFENGGCGIRPFIDLWLMDNKMDYDKNKRNGILRNGKLLTFADACRNLSYVWFSGKDYSQITESMAEFIISGGVYGTMNNKVTIQQSYRGGKFKYALSRIFLPYDALKYHYPVLEKHRWLTPFCEVRRWLKLLFKGGIKRSFYELKSNSKTTDSKINFAKNLIKELEL